jgi:uncharacterized membrane protein YgcG
MGKRDMSDQPERELDRALGTGEPPADPKARAAFETAARVRRDFEVEAPRATAERTLFVRSIGARGGHRFSAAVVVPAALVVAVVLVVALAGRSALPGDTLYPVRQALSVVGIARPAVEEIDRRISEAARRIETAEAAVGSNRAQARRMAIAALGDLAVARELLREVDAAGARERLERVRRLESRALGVIEASASDATEDAGTDELGRGEDEGPDDNRGPGGGDDDNRGPGGGDDDNRGPGSGDDDSSGPGSGDDDSSGPGSGDDTGGGDNSGSGGGGDSGPGGDDSSGSG